MRAICLSAQEQARVTFVCITVSACRSSVLVFRGTHAGSFGASHPHCSFLQWEPPFIRPSRLVLCLQSWVFKKAQLEVLIWPVAWLLLQFRGLPACPCVHTDRVQRSQASFGWGIHSDDNCMPVSTSAAKNPCIWLCLALALRSAERAGGRLAMVTRSAHRACAGLCGSACAGGWQKAGPARAGP